MNEQFLQAYYTCLELAKENAFKCQFEVSTNKGTGNSFFSVWVKKFDEEFGIKHLVRFYTFDIEKLDSNIEKVKQLIKESICQE